MSTIGTVFDDVHRALERLLLSTDLIPRAVVVVIDFPNKTATAEDRSAWIKENHEALHDLAAKLYASCSAQTTVSIEVVRFDTCTALRVLDSSFNFKVSCGSPPHACRSKAPHLYKNALAYAWGFWKMMECGIRYALHVDDDVRIVNPVDFPFSELHNTRLSSPWVWVAADEANNRKDAGGAVNSSRALSPAQGRSTPLAWIRRAVSLLAQTPAAFSVAPFAHYGPSTCSHNESGACNCGEPRWVSRGLTVRRPIPVRLLSSAGRTCGFELGHTSSNVRAHLRSPIVSLQALIVDTARWLQMLPLKFLDAHHVGRNMESLIGDATMVRRRRQFLWPPQTYQLFVRSHDLGISKCLCLKAGVETWAIWSVPPYCPKALCDERALARSTANTSKRREAMLAQAEAKVAAAQDELKRLRALLGEAAPG